MNRCSTIRSGETPSPLKTETALSSSSLNTSPVSSSGDIFLVNTNSCLISATTIPRAENTPGYTGINTRGMDSSEASSHACSGPAPPKANNTKSRGSWPRSTETTLIPWHMLALATLTIPEANSRGENPVLSHRFTMACSASFLLRTISSPKWAPNRPSIKLASVTVGTNPPLL